ncbi:MAG: putative membrane protein [Gammaproteobacteria bacterium]|jgi:uncharacterized membrane protein
MLKYFESLAKILLGVTFRELSDEDKRVIKSIANQESLVENINERFAEELSFGQRLADKVASFGGSWTFILTFISLMASWVLLNTYILVSYEKVFDPYPYILLNLGLSGLAALQAPIIMMSQNRQAEKDRMKVDANYEVNLKLELEILRLHQKIDVLMEANN